MILREKGLRGWGAYLAAPEGPSFLAPAACCGSPSPLAGPGTDDSSLWWGRGWPGTHVGMEWQKKEGKLGVCRALLGPEVGQKDKGLLDSCGDSEKLGDPENLGKS